MRVLVTGANGFIGRHLVAAIVDAGHHVVAAVRNPGRMQRRFPNIEVVQTDMNRDTTPDTWRTRLVGVDAVVNCAGILQQTRTQFIEAIHFLAPKALFDACVQCNVRRVVQISAVSADAAAETAYAATKERADEYLAGLDLDWVVLRPSLVYAGGSYGGTSLLRALAALPWLIPVPGRGQQKFRPIFIDDLAQAVLGSIEDDRIARVTLAAVGPHVVTLAEILVLLRSWLGLPRARFLPMPDPIIRAFARIGDRLGTGPLNSTALRQLEYGNTAAAEPFVEAFGFVPRAMESVLRARPSHAQDLWHARLYFLRPALRWSLGALWTLSGLVGFLAPAAKISQIATGLGLRPEVFSWWAYAADGANLAIGVCLFLRLAPFATAVVQLCAIAGYTLALSLAMPDLWIDPFGPLLKNIPIAIAVLVLAAIEEER